MAAPSSQPRGDSQGLRRVRLSEWARGQGIARITAYRMLQRGILPVPTERSPTGRWYVLLPDQRVERVALYARAAPGPDQAIIINEQIASLSEWMTSRRQQPYIVTKEIGTPFAGNMQKLAHLLADSHITEIVIAKPWVVGDGMFQLLVAALAPQGRTLTAATSGERRTRGHSNDLRAGIVNLCKLYHGSTQGVAAARRALASAD